MRERIRFPRSLARKSLRVQSPQRNGMGLGSSQPHFCFRSNRMEKEKFEVEVNPATRVMTVAGVKYSFDVFNTLAFPRTDRLFKFRRDGDLVIVTDCGPVPTDEVIETAMLAPAQPRARQYERR